MDGRVVPYPAKITMQSTANDGSWTSGAYWLSRYLNPMFARGEQSHTRNRVAPAAKSQHPTLDGQLKIVSSSPKAHNQVVTPRGDSTASNRRFQRTILSLVRLIV